MTPILFDRQLPHLATAFDLAAMTQVFTKALHLNEAFSLESCEIGRIKYKPGQNCLVYYTLYIKDNSKHHIEAQIVCARFYNNDSHSRYQKANKEDLVQPKFGKAMIHIPELELILWLFPNDRKLQHIDKLTDKDFLQRSLLPQVISTHFGQHWSIKSLEHQLVHYAPEHTCTVRAELLLKDTHKEQHLTLYGKTYYNDEGLETYRLMQLLWDSQARKQGLLNIAKPLSYHPEYKMLWQQGLPGHPVITQDISSKHFAEILKQIARTVATLHQTPLYCPKKLSLSDWQQKLTSTQYLLFQLQPTTASKLEPLISDLHLQAKHLPAQPNATLHGDLHLQNFLLYKNTISMIDLDNLCQGSPWQDIGSFIAGLYYRALLENISIATIESLSDIFCQAYTMASPWKLDPEAVRWYTATALINERIYRSITRLKTGRLESINALIALAEGLSTSSLVS